MLAGSFFFIIGTIIGSFLNVCIYRIPRKESLIFPSSRCPVCKTPIKAKENIPIISYILLRGKCPNCSSGISARYPLVESLTGAFFFIIYIFYGISFETLVSLIFISCMIVITFIDLEFQIVPDKITLPGIIAGLIFSFIMPFMDFKDSLLGIIIGGGILYLVAVISRGGMGGGDIKLSAMIGAFLGWRIALFSIFIAVMTGAFTGLFLIIIGKKKRKDPIPFGPFLALGGIIGILLGESIINFYFRII